MLLSLSTPREKNQIYLLKMQDAEALTGIPELDRSFIELKIKAGVDVIPLLKGKALCIYVITPDESNEHRQLEKLRLLANRICGMCNEFKLSEISIKGGITRKDEILAFCEGMLLSNYQFNKYKTRKKTFNINSLKTVHVGGNKLSVKQVEELNNIIASVYFTRDLVNEPLSYLTAKQYSKTLQNSAKKNGFKVEVWDQKKIASLKMGGIMAVNKGSVQQATFNILEHKPQNPVNKKPIVLVGKGVMFDTGGLSLKPTKNSMDMMKCDMAGSAIVAGTLMAVASNQLPVHVIGLIPAVENRPGGDAIVPGDVITMYDKTTVEVLNTDAEGRLILADALAYAKKLKPELVMDFATLTGAASRAVGPHAIALMGNYDSSVRKKIMASAEHTYERLVEFPLWDEYGDMLKSTIADMKNIGGAESGAITAGKFLEHFTDYPWMHFDVAPVSYFLSPMNYRGINGTGTGVRLAYHFIRSLTSKRA